VTRTRLLASQQPVVVEDGAGPLVAHEGSAGSERGGVCRSGSTGA
jgi:hypothetical protein